MPIHLNIGGVYREGMYQHSNIGGTWRNSTEQWTNINGSWRVINPSGSWGVGVTTARAHDRNATVVRSSNLSYNAGNNTGGWDTVLQSHAAIGDLNFSTATGGTRQRQGNIIRSVVSYPHETLIRNNIHPQMGSKTVHHFIQNTDSRNMGTVIGLGGSGAIGASINNAGMLASSIPVNRVVGITVYGNGLTSGTRNMSMLLQWSDGVVQSFSQSLDSGRIRPMVLICDSSDTSSFCSNVNWYYNGTWTQGSYRDVTFVFCLTSVVLNNILLSNSGTAFNATYDGFICTSCPIDGLDFKVNIAAANA